GSRAPRKGTLACPFALTCDVAGLLKSALPQGRNQHHFLGCTILRDFGFLTALWKFLASAVASHPDLRKEIVISITMEHQLGLRRGLAGFASCPQDQSLRGVVRRANGYRVSEPQSLHRVLSAG